MKDGANYKAAIMVALAEQAAADLIGTCKALYELGPDYVDAQNNATFCARLDELAFECTRCNWWHGQEECEEDDSGQWICSECKNE